MMKKSYIVLALAVLVATASCRKSDQEVPDKTGRPTIKTSTIGFAESNAVQVGDPMPTPAIQYTVPGVTGEQAETQAGTQVGVITPMGAVDTAALSRLTKAETQHSTETFRAGDMIGVFVHTTAEVNEGEANHTVNTPYIIADGVNWAPVYALGGPYTEPQYYMSAYYPYNESLTNPWEIPHSVALDQSAPVTAVSGALEKSNLLIARGASLDHATTGPSALLNFVHAMSLFEVKIHLPIMVEGRELDSLESIVVKGTETRATLNLATGGITVVAGHIADIKPRRVSGNGHPGVVSVFESIVVPQNVTEGVTLLEIRCRMVDGSMESFDYTIPKLNWMSFKSGYRTSITLMPTAEASFMGELPQLIDGLAHEDMVLPIFVAKDLRWTLSVENIDWMTISDAPGGSYGKTLSGNSTTGAQVNVYVKVAANSSQTLPRQGEMTLRAYRSDGSEVAPAVYLAVQNYYNFSGSGSTWNATAAEGSTPVAPFSGNQSWKATSGADWVKLAKSATYGDGDPVTIYSHIGALFAGQLFLQADANNTAGARETAVSFASDHVGGTSFLYTVKQPAPDAVLSATEVGVGAAAGSDFELVTVTAPVGVKWQVLSASGSIAGFTTVPAVGTEMEGTGVAQAIKVSYGENTGTSELTNSVVVAFAAMGAGQQKTVTVKQSIPSIKVNGLLWAAGNLVADGANKCKVGAPGDGGLYFQYGSLIGYKGGANGDGTGIVNAAKHPNGVWWNGATAYSASEVVVKPATYTNQATWPNFENAASGGFGYYYFNSFVTKYADFQSQPNANNPALGIGDPCAYYLGSPWRLPTYVELSAITGNATEGAWVPWATAGVTGRWEKNGPKSAIGAWFGPNSRTGTPTEKTDLFIPASGHRVGNTGTFTWVGIHGHLWSSSVVDIWSGFYLLINESSGVYPRRANNRAHGFPVRCVQDAPTEPQPPTANQVIEVNGLKWTKGNLVATGGHNAKVGAPGDGGLYFQYGSLIGYKGGANGDGTGVVNATTHADGKWWNGAAAYSAADVAVKPATYTNQATWPNFENVASGGFGYYYFNSFVTKYADFQPQPNANNPTLGIGDPCAYYLGSDWRLPTYVELSAITGSAVEGAWVKWDVAGVTGRWEKNGPKSAIGAWFGPNSRTGTPTEKTDLFIPASGHRMNSTGTFTWVGIYGYLWSSSVYDAIRGFFLDIHESAGMIPRHASYRAYAFPVRCVEGVSVGTNPADWTGVVAAGATLEVVVSVGGASGWTAQPSATAGFTATPTSGKSGDKITLTWADNTAEGSPARSATVVFTAQGSAQTYTFNTTQESAEPPHVVINGTKWQLSNAGTAIWANAPALCSSPWRLPSKSDFENLINSGKMSQVTGISSGYYWSSTENSSYHAWNLDDGSLNYSGKNSSRNVRCCQ